MNRREFTASLAAFAATPAMPLGLSAATAPQSAFVPAGTYAWAQLIARAQNRCSPAMLARQLHLPAEAAQQLFAEMVRDGVLRAPGLAGAAQATQPINATGATPNPLANLRSLLPSEAPSKKVPALAKDDPVSLMCENTAQEDQTDASETQSIQESPEER